MAFDSFRDFIGQLDRVGELKRIAQPVATELKITELANREIHHEGVPRRLHWRAVIHTERFTRRRDYLFGA